MTSWRPFHGQFLFVTQFWGLFFYKEKGHEFGLMVVGDEFGLRLGENGGRNVFCRHEQKILQKFFFFFFKKKKNRATYAGKRLTSQLIGVSDADGCKCYSRRVCDCGASARVRTAVLSGRSTDPTSPRSGLACSRAQD